MKMPIKIKTAVLLLLGAGAGVGLALWWYRSNMITIEKRKSRVQVPTEKIKKEILDNGMKVLVFSSPSVPKVLVQIAYDVGSYVEESGERGLAHLIEHMIFKGTDRLAEGDIDAIARKYGAKFNAYTSSDVTSYYFESNKANWQPFVEILADCMSNSRFEEEHLASELKAVIQELRIGKDNYWRIAMQKAASLLFPSNHPYHAPVIGYKEDLLNIKAHALKKFYKKYYRPDRATLFIVGDVDSDEAISLAKKHFGGIQCDEKSVNKEFPQLVPELVTHRTRLYEDVSKEALAFYWSIPGIADKDEMFSSAIESLLGKGHSSRLYKLLVEDKKVASSVYIKASKFVNAGIFFIVVEPILGKIDKCRSLIQKELSRITHEGFTDDELERMAKGKIRSFVQKMQHQSDFVYRWIKSFFTTGNEFDIFERINRYNSITSAQLQEFIKTHLDPFLMNQIEILPLPESRKDIKQAAKELSDSLDQEILKRHQRTRPLEDLKAVYECSEPVPLDFSFPKPDREFTLPNGLTVLLKQKNIWPIVTLKCQFKDASFFSNTKEGALIDLMMDMLIEGSDGYTKKQNVDIFEIKGVGYGFGQGGGKISLLSEDIEQVFEHFLHVLQHPTFPKEALDRLKAITINSYERAKDSAASVGSRALRNQLYNGTPYAWTFDEAIELVEGVTTDDLVKLHKKYVTPSSMVMAVVGNFEPEQMEQKIRDLFGQWTGSAYQQVTWTPGQFEPRREEDIFMVRDQVVLMMGQPSPLTIYDQDVVPLRMLNFITFHSLGSRIYQLREESGMFYSASGGFAINAARHHGFDYLSSSLSLENLEAAEKQMCQMIDDVATGGVTEQELAASQQLYLKELIDLVGSNKTIATMFCSLYSLGLGFDYYDKVLARVQAMTVKELNEIAAKYLKTENMARVRVGRVGK